MTATDYRSPAEEASVRSERARRAVEQFRRMQPMLNNYARVFTGNPRISVEVSATHNGATDGKKIWFRPPIALGDNLKHVRKMCDKRDPDTLLQECPACAVREEVLVTIYHEIAHICYETFKQPEDGDKASLIAAAVAETGGKYAEYVAERIRRSPSWQTASYMGMAGTVNPYLHTILNALEDARVNNNLFNARRGTKVMFDADTSRTFSRGVECPQPDGSVKYLPWNEREQNLQAILAVFCHASGYNYQDWFIPPVVQVLGDDALQGLIRQSVNSDSVAENYGIAFKVLARLRELGFCKRPDEPDTIEEEKPTKPGESEDKADDGEAGESQEESNEEEADDAGADSGDSESPDPSGSGSGDSDGGETDEDGSDESASEELAPPSGDGDTEDGENESSSVAGDSEGESDPDTREDDEGVDSDSESRGDADLHEEEQPESESTDGGASGDRSDSRGDDGLESGPAPEQDDSESASDDADLEDRDGDSTEEDESDSSDEAESNTQGSEELTESDPEDVIDTGADEGKGGVEVQESDQDYSHIEMGEPEDVDAGLKEFGHHDPQQMSAEQVEEEEAVNLAIMQGIYFETPSVNVLGVQDHHYGKPVLSDNGSDLSTAWHGKRFFQLGYDRTRIGIDGDFLPAENVLGPALLKLRTVLADNARAHNQHHLKSGRINTRVLGRRAPLGDERLFRKKTVPAKKSYFVAIGLDVSGSTVGRNIGLIKASAYAQADLLTRLGIPFSIHAYTSSGSGRMEESGIYLAMYHIKDAAEPWNITTQGRLLAIGPDGGNLDGHNLEYLRKVCDQQQATEKIIMYFSDGKMPATNYSEELEILVRELATCKKKGYIVAGVGVRTDSPSRHGMPTVQINDKSEVIAVVRHLEKLLRG